MGFDELISHKCVINWNKELFGMFIFATRKKLQILVQLHDLQFTPFISEEKIMAAIEDVSKKLNAEWKEEKPVFLGILNGAFLFASELIKRFEGDCEVNFVRLNSYEGTNTSGNVKMLSGLNRSLENRSVIVIEDIVDTGNTLESIDSILKAEKVKQYKIATLFYKPEAYKKSLPIDYIGLEIPNDFIVGFGLDYNELGRNLRQVYKLKK